MFCSEDALFLLFSDIFFFVLFLLQLCFEKQQFKHRRGGEGTFKMFVRLCRTTAGTQQLFFLFFLLLFFLNWRAAKRQKDFFPWSLVMCLHDVEASLSLSSLPLSLSSLSSACSSLHVDQVFNLKAVRVYKARARFINLMCGSVL